MDSLKLPELDLAVLEEKAKEAAMKGAIKEIEDYYTGYNSPLRKQIKDNLESNTMSVHLELPDILGLINQSLSVEFDRIANNCIAESFVPMATKALLRVDKNIKFSNVLEEFIQSCRSDFKDGYSPEISVDKDGSYGWLNVVISFTDFRGNEIKYEFTLHEEHKEKGKYCLLSLPRMKEPYGYRETMKLSNGELSIEIPFTRDILKDGFTSYLARIIMCNSTIEMDCDDFSEDMFESEF